MFGRFALSLAFYVLSFAIGGAVTSLDTALVNKSVVFSFGADPLGHVLTNQQVATGFLISVPAKNGRNWYPLLVTARHVVDPLWAGCAPSNPARFFVRVNKKRFDPQTDETGVDYIAVELITNGTATWIKSDDESVDVAVLKAPPWLTSGDYDINFVN